MRAARFGVTSFGVTRFGVTGISFGCTNTAITEFVICRPSLAQGVPLSMIHSTPILSNADYSFGQKIRWLRLLWRTLQDRRLYRVADAILAQSAAKAPVVLDIGANVGAFSRAFVKAGLRPGLVLAFEPSSYVFSILQIVTRRLHQVQCHKIALSSAAGSVDLQTPIKTSGSLRVGLSYIGAATDSNTLTETVHALFKFTLCSSPRFVQVHAFFKSTLGSSSRLIQVHARFKSTLLTRPPVVQTTAVGCCAIF